MSKANEIITHLEQDYTIPIRDPLWKHIYLSPALEKVIFSLPFSRLGRLKQLGLASQVYPGSVHTRLNHSLGVFHMAKKIIRTILGSPFCPDHLTLVGVKAFLSASLLHDLGHFPYAHVLEDGLDVLDHEVITGRVILDSELSLLLSREVGTIPELTAAIVDHRLSYKPQEKEVQFFRRLLSGVLDPDKLDYLNRDAYFCGIPYGTQDTDFITSQIVPHPQYGLAITSKGVMAVEHLLFSKYLMYKSVYWHKGVRSPSAIIKKALYLGLKEGVITPETLYPLDDVNFAQNLGELGYEPLQQIGRAEIPGSFLTLYEEPYDENSLLSLRLVDAKDRIELENSIRKRIEHETGQRLREEDITLDIPHSVSFEVDLPVWKNGKLTPFMESGTVFDKQVVKGFATSLKKLRIIGPSSIKGMIRSPESLLNS